MAASASLRNVFSALRGLHHARQLSGAALGTAGANMLEERVASLLASGEMRADPRQTAVVASLAALLDDLARYSASMASHHSQLAAYEGRRQRLLAELARADSQEQRADGADKAAEMAAAPAAAAAPATPSAPGGGIAGWFSSWRAAPVQAGSEGPRERARRARAAAAAREARVVEALGPPPPPPPPPRGVYLHGSVGSGKTMLMDLFYEAATQAAGLRHCRRLHFNSALLEVHQRLHRLEAQGQAPRRGDSPSQHTPAPTYGEEPGAREEGEGEGGGAGAVTAGGRDDFWVHGVARGAGDAGSSGRQHRRAVVSIRRHIRQQRAGLITPEVLGAANSDVMREAVRSLLRGTPGQPDSGWGGGSGGGGGGRVAALLCFDELQVTDPFTAAALKALFEVLSAEGVVLCATSNRAPWELPRHGLHEDMFDHLITTIQDTCQVVTLNSEDYRRLIVDGPAARQLQMPLPDDDDAPPPSPSPSRAATDGAAPHPAASPAPAAAARAPPPLAAGAAHGGVQQPRFYYWPDGPAARSALQRRWERLPEGSGPGAAGASTLPVLFGRSLDVRRSRGGAAWFEFEELCARPLGAADYLALCSRFHTVFVAGVPQMSLHARDKARRFITLVDEAYNARTRLVVSAAAPPDALFSGSPDDAIPLLDLEGLQFEGAVEGSRLRRDVMAEGGVAPVAASAAAANAAAAALGGQEEQFAFARAVSRLYEMQSPLFGRGGALSGDGGDGPYAATSSGSVGATAAAAA